MYFPGLDLLLAGLYLFFLWREAIQSGLGPLPQAMVGILWQLPGIFLAGSVLLNLDQATDFSYYFIFMLQLWHTPVLPFLNLIPVMNFGNMPLYYYLLFVMVPLLWAFYLFPAIPGRQAKIIVPSENN